MKKYLFALYMLTCLGLYGEAPLVEDGSVSSTHASYDGNALLLQGHVQLDHGLGKMSAEQASLEKQEAGKDFPFSLIHLKKDVLLSLRNSSQIKCETAELDFTSLKGNLLAKDKEKVSYVDLFKGKGNKQTPFRLLSNAIELAFNKNEKEEKKVDYEIATLFAKEDVIIDYANAFVLRAHHAIYQRAPSADATGSPLAGTITAFPKDSESRCLVTHASDWIESDKMELDINHSILQLSHPKGSLASSFFSQNQKGQIQFECEHLVWDQNKNTLMLQKDVRLQDNFMGTMTAEQDVKIEQGESQGKKHIKNIHTEGVSRFHYQDPVQHWNPKLTCKGVLHVDGQKGQISLSSPQEKGKTKSDQQIYYEDESLGVHADQALIEYAESSFVPVSLTLKGNVRIFSHDSQQPPRCGLSDRLVYSPDTKTLILSASPGKRVLFWDEEQGIRMSAREVHLTEDPVTHKNQIKGIGNVQFSLSTEEHEMLRKFFPQYSQPIQESHE